MLDKRENESTAGPLFESFWSSEMTRIPENIHYIDTNKWAKKKFN